MIPCSNQFNIRTKKERKSLKNAPKKIQAYEIFSNNLSFRTIWYKSVEKYAKGIRMRLPIPKLLSITISFISLSPIFPRNLIRLLVYNLRSFFIFFKADDVVLLLYIQGRQERMKWEKKSFKVKRDNFNRIREIERQIYLF